MIDIECETLLLLQYMDCNNIQLINRFCQRLAHFKPSPDGRICAIWAAATVLSGLSLVRTTIPPNPSPMNPTACETGLQEDMVTVIRNELPPGSRALTAAPPAATRQPQQAPDPELSGNTEESTDSSESGSDDSFAAPVRVLHYTDLPLRLFGYARYPRRIPESNGEDPRRGWLSTEELRYYVRVSRADTVLNVSADAASR